MEAIVINNANLSMSHLVSKNPIIYDKMETKERYIGFLKKYIKILNMKSKYVKAEMEAYEEIITNNAECIKAYPMGFYKYYILFDLIHIIGYEPKAAGLLWKWDELKETYSSDFRMASKDIYRAIVGCDYKEIGKSNKNYKTPLGMLSIIDRLAFEDLLWLFEEEPELEYIESIKKNIEFKRKKPYKIMVTATMSAGKSTLLNSLVGKKVNKTQNDACTAKAHLLFNKAFEDGLSYKYDFELELDADYEVLMEDNKDNNKNEIFVGTRFRSIEEIDKPICFIDTPGVNSSKDRVHREISENAITSLKCDVLMYLMNGENIGTDDDRKHLEFVLDNFKGNVIFVVNKLDAYRKEDSVADTLEKVKKDLQDIGYVNPVVCPVSAYAAYLAKMSLFGERLNDDEQDELEMFYCKLKKEKYRLNNFYPDKYRDISVSEDENEQLLLHSGLLSLEKILYEERKKK